ncbi:MAG: transposase [Chthoniobacterales bacterium]|nr:transposase [Chthoniobacterales bacterium]
MRPTRPPLHFARDQAATSEVGSDLSVLRRPTLFVTVCTLHRRKITSLAVAHDVFEKYALRARAQFNVAVGRYVIMPNHVHLFVQGDLNFRLERWVSGLKRAISISLGCSSAKPLWQPGFSTICSGTRRATRKSGTTFERIRSGLVWSHAQRIGPIKARSC